MTLFSNGYPGTIFDLNEPVDEHANNEKGGGQQEETIIIAEAESRWPLVMRLWGEPNLVKAHASEIQQLVDSIRITPTH
jgi:hypothetical protein